MIFNYAPLSQRAILTLTGPDTLVLLERIVTHDTKNWDIGTTRYGGLLSPQGKVLSDWLALRLTDGVMLETDAATSAALLKRLKMFRLRSQVEIEVHPDLIALALFDPDGKSLVESTKTARFSYSDIRYPIPQRRVAVSRDTIEENEAALEAYHAQRISLGLCEQSADFDTNAVFPADINMDHYDGIALQKGCFVGQEVVSRMHRRGKIRKRSLVLRLSHAQAVDTGAPVMAETQLGTVTSATTTHALARLRIDRLHAARQAGQTVMIGDTPVELVAPDWLIQEMMAMSPT